MVFILLACSVTNEPSEGIVHVLTYNIHGLPAEITGDDTTTRIEQIAPLLGDFDIVGLQEDFIDENHNIIASAAPHPYRDNFNEKVEDDRYYGSGLSAFSVHPILADQNTHYTACHGYIDSASDCFASKGFQALEIEVAPGLTIHFYNTHLEAGGGQEDTLARQTHVDQLLTSLNGFSADQPVIFLGDTNLHAADPVDSPLLEQLLQEGNLIDSCESVGCTEPEHIDRIFYRNSPNMELTVQQWINQDGFVDLAGLDLSDHPAISAHISWNHTPQ